MSEPKNKTKPAPDAQAVREEIDAIKLELLRILVKLARLAERALLVWADSKKSK